MWWAKRTNTGRVVYDRKKHPFKWSDARRITRSLPIPEPYDENYIKEYWNLVQTTRTCLAALSLAGLAQFEEVLDTAVTAVGVVSGSPRAIFRGLLDSMFDFSKILILAWEKRN